MKNIVKLSFYIGLLVIAYFTAGNVINELIPEQDSSTNISLLFQYGGMIGFSLFVIFLIMIQTEGMRRLRDINPRTSNTIFYAYMLIGILFIIWTMISFTIQLALIMALLFMLVTVVLDVIRDKIIQVHEGNQLHPKKTI